MTRVRNAACLAAVLTAAVSATLLGLARGAAPPATAPATAPAAAAKDADMQAILHAPELPKEASWLNTDRPLQFSGDLKGQVVLMDFWCYCCINCMHVIPDLDF